MIPPLNLSILTVSFLLIFLIVGDIWFANTIRDVKHSSVSLTWIIVFAAGFNFFLITSLITSLANLIQYL